MPTVFDVASYILEKHGSMTHMKLQKLVYYSQAWSLVWDEEPLFSEKIRAWANGPVVKELFSKLQGSFKVERKDLDSGASSNLSPEQTESIDRVLAFYGDKDPQWLSDLTHMEPPWKDARCGLGPGDRGNQEITINSMAEYYGSL